MSRDGLEFVRLQALYRGRLGVEVGVFVAVDHLRRADRLTEVEEELYFGIDDWFQEHLPNPPFYDDGNSIGAVTWFKRQSSAGMVQRLTPLCDILTKYGVPWVAAQSADPGAVVYEDQFQIGVIPYVRHDPSPSPPGLVLGPTTSGSKRQFGKKARAAATHVAAPDA
jgi:hypothetical protein